VFSYNIFLVYLLIEANWNVISPSYAAEDNIKPLSTMLLSRPMVGDLIQFIFYTVQIIKTLKKDNILRKLKI